MSTKQISLRAARKRRKLTQMALAAKVGKAQSFISKLENGIAPEPSFTEVTALATALGVSPFRLKFTHRDSVSA